MLGGAGCTFSLENVKRQESWVLSWFLSCQAVDGYPLLALSLSKDVTDCPCLSVLSDGSHSACTELLV